MDVAFGKCIMMRSSIQSWNEIYHGLIPVEIEGWLLTLVNDCDPSLTVQPMSQSNTQFLTAN
jgi:hypothetical protein